MIHYLRPARPPRGHQLLARMGGGAAMGFGAAASTLLMFYVIAKLGELIERSLGWVGVSLATLAAAAALGAWLAWRER